MGHAVQMMLPFPFGLLAAPRTSPRPSGPPVYRQGVRRGVDDADVAGREVIFVASDATYERFVALPDAEEAARLHRTHLALAQRFPWVLSGIPITRQCILPLPWPMLPREIVVEVPFPTLEPDEALTRYTFVGCETVVDGGLYRLVAGTTHRYAPYARVDAVDAVERQERFRRLLAALGARRVLGVRIDRRAARGDHDDAADDWVELARFPEPDVPPHVPDADARWLAGEPSLGRLARMRLEAQEPSFRCTFHTRRALRSDLDTIRRLAREGYDVGGPHVAPPRETWKCHVEFWRHPAD